MYTVYDFINTEIEPKHMKFGWKVEIKDSGLSSSSIILKYDMLNFDWHSTDYINDELWNMFLKSISYRNMRDKMDRAMMKHKRLYFDSYSIEGLKNDVNECKLKINIDKLIETAVRKRSERIKEKISEQKSLQENGSLI